MLETAVGGEEGKGARAQRHREGGGRRTFCTPSTSKPLGEWLTMNWRTSKPSLEGLRWGGGGGRGWC